MAKYRNGDESSRPAAHTSGSALGVLVLSFRLACTPLATPSTPVMQVMIPKIRLWRERQKDQITAGEIMKTRIIYILA